MTEYGHGGDIYSQEVELDYSANIKDVYKRQFLLRIKRGSYC